MDYYKELDSIFGRHLIGPEAQGEIRRLIAIITKDSEKKGYSEGWGNGFESRER